MPLDTSMAFADFASRCTYTGDWLIQRRAILQEGVKRQWHINVYCKDSEGKPISIDHITSPTKMDKVALNDLIDIALLDAQKIPNIDLTKSYMTVSC